ncbi:glycoside hydrolase family 97 protein [uncultured Duncaniella sp.]|uniref:glycoside hydrolase family 97 protein n=1 Tax=uncultured Duncaniella sp. TaxID=2768039 RepID=UPI0025DB9E4D|nr:glycoside hydrolase family 97 protein [uncultured Duncaniella sp.]
MDNTLRKQILTFFALLPTVFSALSGSLSVKSPDGMIEYYWSDDDGHLCFEAFKSGKQAIVKSPVNFILDGRNVTDDCSVISSSTYSINETYPTRGLHTSAVNNANGVRMKLSTDVEVDARAYNDGVAFRIISAGDRSRKRVPDEATEFNIPAGSHVWYHDMYNHYEGEHRKCDISEIKEGEWVAPPVTVRLPDGNGYLCISESGLRDYPGMSLQSNGKRGLVTRLGHAQPVSYPFAHDYSLDEAKRLSVAASIAGEIKTPWRCVVIASDLNALVNTDLISNLSPAPDKRLFPEGVNTEWIKPGRSVWCWLDGGERTVEGMKEFSRLAGELGYEYNTVDAFWYRWTDEQIKELVDYSAGYGVRIWLWRHGRDLRAPAKRKELFDRCSRLGIAGIKLDAFSHESKEFVDMYQACLREAAEHKLMLNIHGSNKPTGEVRTWPNEMSREGVQGLEYGKHQFSWAKHNVTLPFTRYVAGHGDYTPVIFGERRLDTSWCHQVATAIVFNSSVIFFGAHPQSIIDNPAADLFKSIPAVWDETIVLPGSEIGEVAAYARRSGDDWYLAILNGEEARTMPVSLSFLSDDEWYEAQVYRDRPGDGASMKKEKLFCRKNDSLTARLRAGGGYVVKFNVAGNKGNK